MKSIISDKLEPKIKELEKSKEKLIKKKKNLSKRIGEFQQKAIDLEKQSKLQAKEYKAKESEWE